MTASVTHTSLASWCAAGLVLAFGAAIAAQTATPAVPDQAALEAMTARFAPTDIAADVTGLPANERQALGKLVQGEPARRRAVPASGLGRQRGRCCCGC